MKRVLVNPESIIRSSSAFPVANDVTTRRLHRDSFQIHQGFKFNFPISNGCQWGAKLIIVVCSGFDNIFERHVIRNTWGSNEMLTQYLVMIRFLIGDQKEERPYMNVLINKENEIFQDIIQADFIDTYDNLTLKSIALVHWVKTYCGSAEYILKIDDDVYVNTKILVSFLQTKNATEKHMIGLLRKDIKVIRHQPKKHMKWVMSYEEYPNDTYPLYLLGAAYVISGSAVSALYDATFRVPLFRLEDVYITGLCAKEAGISLLNCSHLFFESKRSCRIARQAISAHGLKPAIMIRIHRMLRHVTKWC